VGTLSAGAGAASAMAAMLAEIPPVAKLIKSFKPEQIGVIPWIFV
jgi:hypothetical protein